MAPRGARRIHGRNSLVLPIIGVFYAPKPPQTYIIVRMERRAGIALGILMACCPCASALNSSLDITQYAHTAWKIRDGFSKGRVTSFAHTPAGYLWLGTEFGLLRFDGIRHVLWDETAGGPLPSRYV